MKVKFKMISKSNYYKFGCVIFYPFGAKLKHIPGYTDIFCDDIVWSIKDQLTWPINKLELYLYF